jgi:hypothetical protein
VEFEVYREVRDSTTGAVLQVFCVGFFLPKRNRGAGNQLLLSKYHHTKF